MEQPKISVNGIDLSNRPPGEVVEILLLCIDFVYSPIEVVNEDLKDLFSIIKEYLAEKKCFSKDRKEKMACGRFLRLVSAWEIKWPRLTREGLVIVYWDFILRNQNLALLPGFGLVTKHGDRIAINPEKQAIRSTQVN